MLLCVQVVLTEVKGEFFKYPLQGLKQGMKLQKTHTYAKYHHGGDHDGGKKNQNLSTPSPVSALSILIFQYQ